MRSVFNQLGRGVAAVAVVVMLAAPVQALPKDDDGWSIPRMVKAFKKLVVRTFGDGLIIPRP